MAKHFLCFVDDVPRGDKRAYRLHGRSILAIHTASGEFHAVRGVCAHQGVDLSTGSITGYVHATKVGEYLVREDRPVIRCPRHGYEYDVKTGESRFDPRVRIRSYPTTLEHNRVFVEL